MKFSSVANFSLAIFLFLFLILSFAFIPLTSAFGYGTEGSSDFGYDTEVANYLKKGGDTTTGDYLFNGGWENGGLSIINGSIYGQLGFFYNITSLNITRQDLTIIDGLTVMGDTNLTGELNVGSDSYFNGSLFPSTSLTFDIGSGPLRWGTIYGTTLSIDDIDVANDINILGEITGPFGNFTELIAGNISGSINSSDILNEYWVNESGDTMTGDLNMSLNDITGVGRMTLKEDGSIYFGSSAARIYSGGTNYVFIQASDTIELKSSNEIIFRADNDLNDLHVFGVTDYGAIDTPYFGTLYSDMELRPGTGTVNVIGNLNVAENFTVDTNTLFINANSNRVGIGTSSPAADLQINTHTGTIPANTGIWITGPKTIRFGSLDNNAGYGAYIQPAFEGTGTERTTLKLGTRYGAVDKVIMTLKNSGNVGIGTITPQQTLNVIGNGNFTGNVTAENVFLHSHIFTYTDASLTVPSAGSWVNITFDKNAPSVKARITHEWTDSTNDTFTIQDSGEYKIHMSIVAIDSSATPDSQIEYRVLKNNVEVAGSGRAIDIDRQDYDRSKDSFAIVDLSTGDELNFQFTSDSTTAGISSNCLYLDTCSSAVISIERTA